MELIRTNYRMYLMPLVVSQPLAITFDLIIDNDLIKIVGSWCVSILTTWIVNKYKKN